MIGVGLSSKTVIRSYEPRDERAVLQLMEKYASWDATPTSADVQGFHSQNPDLFFVAEAESKVVGFVYGRESNPPAETLLKWKANKVASIENLAVAEEHRRKGIGTALLNQFFDACRQSRIDLVHLAVPAEEAEARKLYWKLGFAERAYFLSKRL